jgi:hypothetical protein
MQARKEMKKMDVLVCAYDIEMSGASQRKNRKKFEPLGHEGDIIGIGAALIHMSAKTGERTLVDSLLIPMFTPLLLQTSYQQKLWINGKEYHPQRFNPEHDALGCNVINPNDFRIYPGRLDGKEIPIISLPYEKSLSTTLFEERCWKEFWSTRVETLEKLKSEQAFRTDTEAIARDLLSRFREKCEDYAKENGYKLIIASDNVSYDIGNLNQFQRFMPFLYRLTDEGYNGVPACTTSMQKGLLSVVDPVWLSFIKERDADIDWVNWLVENNIRDEKGTVKWWSLTHRIRYLYHLPEPEVEHDHLPNNDAYTIAWEYLDIQAIRLGIECVGLGYCSLDQSRVMHIEDIPVDDDDDDDDEKESGEGNKRRKKEQGS